MQQQQNHPNLIIDAHRNPSIHLHIIETDVKLNIRVSRVFFSIRTMVQRDIRGKVRRADGKAYKFVTASAQSDWLVITWRKIEHKQIRAYHLEGSWHSVFFLSLSPV